MEILYDTILPSLLTGSIGLYFGYRLDLGKESVTRRRQNRIVIRKVQNTYLATDRIQAAEEAIRTWWVGGIEDYGRFKRWQIQRIIDRIGRIEFPTPDWHPDDESAYRAASDESKERYAQEYAGSRKDFSDNINRLLGAT